ncbi:hypothetical protein Bca4012_041490 [Brassica carinata]
MTGSPDVAVRCGDAAGIGLHTESSTVQPLKDSDWLVGRSLKFRSRCSGMWRRGGRDKSLTRDRDDSEFMRGTSRQLVANASADDEILVLTSKGLNTPVKTR